MARLPQNVRLDYRQREVKVNELIKDKPLFHEYFHYYYSNVDDHRINIRSIYEYIRVQIAFFEYSSKIFNYDFMHHHPTDAKLELIGYGVVDDYIDHLNNKRTDEEDILTQSTQNTYRIAINSFFAWALEFEYISKNHVRKSIKKIKTKKKIVVSLSEEESYALLELSSKGYTSLQGIEIRLSKHETKYFEKNYLRNNAFIMLMLFLGIRISEVAQLNLNSINYTKKELTVVRKGEEIDVLPLSDSLITMLQAYHQNKSDLEKQSPALFNSFYAGKYSRITSRQMAKILTKYFDMISEPGTYSPHKLRATLATKLLNEGYDLYYVASALNHKSIDTTKIYITEDMHRKRDMLSKVNYGER